MKITKIVITGGPCAGKSTALKSVRDAFAEKGYRVLVIDEIATELINGGISPSACGTRADFQKIRLELQLIKERMFEEAARTMDAEKVLIICDRGLFDGKAYMSADSFRAALASAGADENAAMNGYDAVFHLVTAAKGAEEYYTTANNSARTESAQQAARLDDLVIDAWKEHPCFRVIDNSTGFAEKLERLIGGIAAFLGESE